MKFLKFLCFFFILTLVSSCGSDDANENDCTKLIVVQPQQVITGPTGTTVVPEMTQEVPCEFDEGIPIVGTNVTPLENFTYEVLYFNFIPDTGNNSNRLQFEIKLNNPNSFIAEGTPILTINVDGVISAGGGLANNAISPCFSIDANSSCIYTVDVEGSLDLGIIDNIVLIDVDYWLNN